MTFEEAEHWLFHAVPNFQKDGGGKDYKIGLDGPRSFWKLIGRPGAEIKTIHIAGTNGKGSTAHLLSAGLQTLGYRVGLFSSPHLFSFRERAKVGQTLIDEQFIASFVSHWRPKLEDNKLSFSFFEWTTMLALAWFEAQQVDWIVLETGMGGRLDATNICSPELAVITNIGLDHTQWLGTTRAAIAGEKGGIIKPGTPVVIGEQDAETRPVFTQIARELGAPLFWAKSTFLSLPSDLMGTFQRENIATAATALELLFPDERAVWQLGFERVLPLTGLRGRWEQFDHSPTCVCDTGHNAEAFAQIIQNMSSTVLGEVHWVLNFAADKNVLKLLQMLKEQPLSSHYYWVATKSERCLDPVKLQELAAQVGLHGEVCGSVLEAVAAARTRSNSEMNDLIFVGGSTFVVADLDL